MTGLKFYSEALKRRAIQEVLSGNISRREANRRYGIKGHSTISKWICNLEVHDPFNNLIMDNEKFSKDDLIKRIKELEDRLESEKLRSDGLSKMIDIAENLLKISIRKKSGTKQSRS